MMVSSSVDLPTPLRPSTARLPCSGKSIEMPCSTTASPSPAVTLSSLSKESAMLAFAQIDLTHARIGGNFGRRALGEDRTADQHDNVAGKAEDHVHVVFDEK